MIVAENMFGDILSDEAAMLTGSIGLLPPASLGATAPGPVRARPRLGPGHRGHGRANPLAMLLSAAMMLRHGLCSGRGGGTRIGGGSGLGGGLRTADLGGGRDRPTPPARPREPK